MDQKEQREFEKAKKVVLSSSFHVIRQAAVSTLLRLDEKATLPILLDIFQNPDEEYNFRGVVASELGRIGDQEAVPVLCEMLEQQTLREINAQKQGESAIGAEYMRGKTAEALGMLADSRAAIYLLNAMEMDYNIQESKRTSKSPWSLRLTEKALQKVVERNGVEFLRNSIEELHGLLEAKNPKVRVTTVNLLGTLADMRSLDALLAALEKEYCRNGKTQRTDSLLNALGSVLDKCESVEGLRLYQTRMRKTLGNLMLSGGVEVQTALKELESKARIKRRERASPKDVFSSKEVMLALGRAKLVAYGMRLSVRKLRSSSRL
jgi:HEAT repeat protein